MITLTRFDGVAVQIKATDIVRVRQTEADLGEKGNSRVDGLIIPFYNDIPSAVATAVHAEVASFISLAQPGGKPVWFNGAKASGPVPVAKVDQEPMPYGQIRSALMIGDKIQYVNNTPDEVYNVILAQGGHAEPPIKSAQHAIEVMATLSTLSLGNAGDVIWDAQLYITDAAADM
ncbi:hypothetical protein [Mesorhizobium sp. INR15]|uniref:hypothetical protein n=1 Tax=Mesorhizobium sp. INR15 TaxID=2654248 RepID=UPI00189655D9|nr:hypothetical protein [Mesorhizobium sp. INR15]QPC92017.1 hypothetical protein GA829_16290 [Mesorhizobium sp. INR15]